MGTFLICALLVFLYARLGNIVLLLAGVVFIAWLGWWALGILVALAIGVLLWIWLSDLGRSADISSSSLNDYNPLRAQSRDLGFEPMQTSQYLSSGNAGPQSKQNPTLPAPSAPKSAPPPMLTTSTTTNNLAAGLIIRGEHLENILSGRKTWEMRAKRTNKRETIALIRADSKKVFGVADITESRGPLNDLQMLESIHCHGIEESRLRTSEVAKRRHAWILVNVRRLKSAVPYSHPNGAQDFVRLQSEEIEAIKAQLS